MSTGIILLALGAFYFAAHGLSLLFQRTRIPDVLILLIIGILIGPIFGLAQPEDFGRMGAVMTVIALAVILFESGTSLKMAAMASSLSSVLALTIVTAAVTAGVVALASVAFFDGNWGLAFLTGTILCGTSSAVVIPMVQALRLSEKPGTVLVLESALTDVISIVMTFAILESLTAGEVSFVGISRQVLLSLGVAAVIGLLGGFFWLQIWDKVRKLPTAIFTTIAFAFLLYGIAEISNVSGAIATLTFGITLSNLPELFRKSQFPTISESERSFYQEFVFLLKIFFFIFLGVSARVSDAGVIVAAVLLVAVIYFLRLWITAFLMTKDGVTVRDASVVAVMVPKGLAAAVLASLVEQKGIPQADVVQAIVFSVVIFSIFLTAVLIPLIDGGRLKPLYELALRRFQS